MNSYPTINDVRLALPAKADDYRTRIARLREQLHDEGKDAIAPGHSAGANDIKFNMDCIEQLLASLPCSESVQRVVVCADPEAEEEVVFAVVTSGRGGVNLDIRGTKVQTLSCDAPAATSLLDCRIGHDTALGRIVAVDCDQA